MYRLNPFLMALLAIAVYRAGKKNLPMPYWNGQGGNKLSGAS